MQTRAVRDGDEWVITGRKRWCGNAKAADFIQVLVRERDPEAGESRSPGLGNVLLVKERGTFPEGLSGYPIDKVGYHGFLTWDLHFDGVRIPADELIVAAAAERRATGTDAKRPGSPRRRPSSTPPGCTPRRGRSGWPGPRWRTPPSTCRSASSSATRSGTSRRCGSPWPRWPPTVEQSRAFYRQVAHLLDVGVPCEREAAMVKLQATEMAVRVTNQAMQLHGGNGYTTERQVERHWRDARLTTIFEGTSEIQKRIISDRMLPRSPLT